MNDFFAQPAWNMREQLLNLKRQLRDLKLTERGEQFEFNAKVVVKLAVNGDAIHAQLAKSPAIQPQWDSFAINSAPGMRRLTDEAKKRVQRWTEGQD
jgi:hypothetical protein